MKNCRPIAVIQALLLFLLVAAVVSNFYIMIMQVFYKQDFPKVIGFAHVVVVSGSMQPAIDAGDLLILREQKEYQVGDVVTFRWNNSLVTHRIIAVDGDRVVTKGDSNNVADEPQQISRIEGKVVLCISGAGKLILFLKTPLGILLMIIAAVLIAETLIFGQQRRKKADRKPKN